jgi:PRTRC genetic system protein C
MQVLNLIRKFKYNSVTLPDPNESMSPDQVREFFATQYPELNNALLEGPVTANGVSTWTFLRAAGAKGRTKAPVQTQTCEARELIMKAVASGEAGFSSSSLGPVRESAQFTGRLVKVLATRDSSGRAMSFPSSAFGMWG